MRIKQTVKTLVVGLMLFIGLTLAMAPTVALAECDGSSAQCCGGVNTAIISCTETGGGSTTDSGLWGILIIAINILTAGVGIAAIGGIVYGAILYTSAGGSQEQVKKAMGIITNVVIGIVAYAVMFSALNFLIPGGLFNQ